jgi:hypothetical protein
MDWFIVEFGRDRLYGDVILPTDEYFPGTYVGTREDIVGVVDKLCAHMGISRATVKLVYDDSDSDGHHDLADRVPLNSSWRGAAGHYRRENGRSVITITAGLARRPTALVATIAHELGHALLLGEGHITTEREDHEPLTDLLAIYCGLGIFSANAAFEYNSDSRRWTTNRLGYLTEPMYGYGLARYAWLRGDTDPRWARFLDTNPRTFLKQGLRFLRESAPA